MPSEYGPATPTDTLTNTDHVVEKNLNTTLRKYIEERLRRTHVLKGDTPLLRIDRDSYQHTMHNLQCDEEQQYQQHPKHDLIRGSMQTELKDFVTEYADRHNTCGQQCECQQTLVMKNLSTHFTHP